MSDKDFLMDEYKFWDKYCQKFDKFYYEKDNNKKSQIFRNEIIPLYVGMDLEEVKYTFERIQNVMKLFKGRTLEEEKLNAIYEELYSYSYNGIVYTYDEFCKSHLSVPALPLNNSFKNRQVNKAIITTSANPFHYGHLDLYNKAAKIFLDVKVVIAQNSDKVKANNLKAHMDVYNIPYEIIENQTIADYCKENEVRYIVRGIRNGVDAEYELKLDFINKKINPDVQTIFIPTDDTYSNISSSTIRELIKYKKYDIVKEFMNEEAMWKYINK